MKCRDCKWLNGGKTSVGIVCTNPYKQWRTRVSHIKRPSDKACKSFEMKNEIVIEKLKELMYPERKEEK